jgi:DNA-binding transcriptional LysR family regulator
MRPTAAGERYLATCREVMTMLAEADLLASGERDQPRGILTVTAPLLFGHLHVRPALDAFIDAWPAVRVRLLLIDRIANLVEEGIDLGVRIGPLPDQSLRALKVGEVRRVVCASPDYLARRPAPATPADLAGHEIIAFTPAGGRELWTFGSGPDGGRAAQLHLSPRFSANAAEPAIASAVEGRGITRVLSYQIEAELEDGRLVLLLEPFEPAPSPVHIVYPEARLPAARLRACIDLLAPRLKASLRALTNYE